jgi:hypothetical protein
MIGEWDWVSRPTRAHLRVLTMVLRKPAVKSGTGSFEYRNGLCVRSQAVADSKTVIAVDIFKFKSPARIRRLPLVG